MLYVQTFVNIHILKALDFCILPVTLSLIHLDIQRLDS